MMPFRLDRTAHHSGTHGQSGGYQARRAPASPPTLIVWLTATTSIIHRDLTARLSPRAGTPTAMGDLFNVDFQDFLRALWLHGVCYVLVGGYSVILPGYIRTTGGLNNLLQRGDQSGG